MLVIDENSKTFQREVINFLISKLLQSHPGLGLNPSQVLNDINLYLEKNNINDIESLLSKSSEISKILHVSSNALSSYISKNVFKVIQYLKKEKEMLNLYLSDEKSSFLNILKNFFPSDLLNSYFMFENDRCVLVQPNRKIVENTHGKIDAITKPVKPVELKTKEVKEKPQIIEKSSIIQEILEQFSHLNFIEDLSSKLEKTDLMSKTLDSKVERNEKFSEQAFSKDEKSQEEKKAKSVSIVETVSIIEEILNSFSGIFPIQKQLQILLPQEEDIQPSIQPAKANNAEKSTNNHPQELENKTISIPFTISDYLDLRQKVFEFKNNQDMVGYQHYISSSNQSIRACIALMNLQKKESEPMFNLKTEIQKVSTKLNIPASSLHEFYQRIKRFNVCIGAMKQAAEYLKKSNPELYKYFISLKEPLLDFLSELRSHKEEEIQMEKIQKKLKILLLSIQDENIRNKLSHFILHLIQKMVKFL